MPISLASCMDEMPLRAVTTQVHRVNPLMQRNMRPLENRAGADGEVLLALVAAVEAALARRDPLAEAANRAARAVRPKPLFQDAPAVSWSGIILKSWKVEIVLLLMA